MKEFFKKLAIYLAILTALYGIISFVTLEPNPFEWHWFFRLFWIFVVFSSLCIFDEDVNW